MQGRSGTDRPEGESRYLIAAAQAVVRPIGAICALFGLLVLGAYLVRFEPLYRPVMDGPATHPLSAACILLLGIALVARFRGPESLLRRLCVFLVTLLTSVRLLDALLGSDLTGHFTPFQGLVAADRQAGGANDIGINTAVALLAIALAIGSRTAGRMLTSQLVSFVALSVPTISLTGHAYGLQFFYGQMSLLTSTLVFALGAAAILSTADKGVMRVLLSPHIGGRLARVQTLAGYLVPTALGYVLVRSISTQTDGSLVGMFIVAICWFIIAMVSVSAIVHEHVDSQRRASVQRLEQAAMNDPLTGLPNRRKFFEYAAHELKRLQRTGSSAWLLMLDVDHFKRVNDLAGHATGDRVLVAVAAQLQASVRAVDLASRIGGEEFALLLTDTTRRGAERVGNSVMTAVEALDVDGWTAANGSVTVSIGCARIDDDAPVEQALEKADCALYFSKLDGRNRMTFAEDLRPSLAMVGGKAAARSRAAVDVPAPGLPGT